MVEFFGAWIYLILLSLLAAIVVALRRKQFVLILQFGGLLACAIIGYAAPSATTMKREIFGAFFYGTLFCLLFCSMLYLNRILPESMTSGYARRLGAIAILLIAFFSFRDGQGHFPPSTIVDSQRGYDGIYAIISQQRQLLQYGLSSPGTPLRVFMPIPSPVTVGAFQYRSLALDHLPLTISSAIDARNLATLTAGVTDADVVVVQDPDLASKVFQYPAVALLGKLRGALGNYGFTEIGSVSLTDGKLIAYARPTTKSGDHPSQ